MNLSKYVKFSVESSLAGAFCLLFFMTDGVSEATANSISIPAVDSVAMTAAHNQWRSITGVPDLKWSDELATTSRQWADQLVQSGCNMKHSTTHHGENIYFASAAYRSDGASSILMISEQNVVDAWGNEVNNYDYESNSCHGVCGHYTQIVWQNTTEVGCGMALCNDKAQIWVCQYDPRGNLAGQRPYSQENEVNTKVSLF